MKPVGRMSESSTPGLPVKAPPSPEVEAGPFPTTTGARSQVTSQYLLKFSFMIFY